MSDERKVDVLAADAARYRYLRRKFCFTGNGDGTASMHATNLPDASSFPGIGDVEDLVDQTIDAALAALGATP